MFHKVTSCQNKSLRNKISIADMRNNNRLEYSPSKFSVKNRYIFKNASYSDMTDVSLALPLVKLEETV